MDAGGESERPQKRVRFSGQADIIEFNQDSAPSVVGSMQAEGMHLLILKSTVPVPVVLLNRCDPYYHHHEAPVTLSCVHDLSAELC
jgi:hypothetical protein